MTAALAGCGLFPFQDEGSATIVIDVQQTGCCYIEGAMHYARLDGPVSGELSLEGGVDGAGELDFAEPFPIGRKQLTVVPGHYELSVWARPCDGNCENLDPPTDEAATEFDVGDDEVRVVSVDFVLGEQTRITVDD